MRFFDGILRDFGGRRSEEGAAPVRPSIPLLLMIGLSAWASCALLWPMAEGVSAGECLAFAILCAGGALFAVLVFLQIRRAPSLFCLSAGFLLGATFALAGAHTLHLQQDALAGHPTGEALLEACEDAAHTPYGSRCAFIVRFPDGASGKIAAYLDEDVDPPLHGDLFLATVDAAQVPASSSDWAWRSGQAATVELTDVREVARADPLGAVLRLREGAIAALAGEGESSVVLQALVCGYCTEYDETRIKQDFTTCGLAHIVAVSGAHLVIVSALTTIVLQALRLPRIITVALNLLLMLGYLALAGMPVSAVRAFVMAAALQLSFLSKRRSTGLAALGACVFGMIALDPVVAVSASFTLSALSTFGIALFSPLAAHWLRMICGSMPDFAIDTLAMTLASSLLAQPYSTALFSQVPLVSPLANVLSVPLIGPLCGLGIIAALTAAVFPAVGTLLVDAATCGAGSLCALVAWCASLPYASLPVALDPAVGLAASFALSCTLWIAWPFPRRRIRPRRIAAAGAVLALAFAMAITVGSLARGTQLVMLDVGQGDAFLLRSEGRAVLIDTGAYDSLLRSALARQSVVHLDAVIVTHADDDHCGALASLLGTVAVDSVIVAEDALSCGCASCRSLVDDAVRLVGRNRLMGIERGDEIAVGSFTLKTVWPEGFVEEGGNADSLCFVVGCDADADGEADSTALMVGDAEAEQLASMMDEGLLPPAGVDILKVGHHGSKNAFDGELLEELAPRIALISVGEANRYGHPAAEITDALDRSGAATFRTDLQGDVSCKFEDDSVTVSTLR